ncbi:MAG: DUF4292 domain-containing protein [Bacteroidales bacterium]|nr:DUF4292 domain-containing protein [Bacteroidales bacterium]
MNNVLKLSIFLLSFIFLSCKRPEIALKNKELKNFNLNNIFDTINASYINYEHFFSKISVESGFSKYSFKGTLKIRKDSMIWVSVVPMMGIEAARIVITNDSIKILNRIQNQAILKDMSSIKNYLGIDINYKTLQSLLLNELLFLDSTYEKNEFSLDPKKASNRFQLVQYTDKEFKNLSSKNDVLNHIFTVSNTNLRPSEIEIRNFSNSKNLKISYSEPSTTDSLQFPSSILINTVYDTAKIWININYLKVSILDSQDYKFSIPDGYKILN